MNVNAILKCALFTPGPKKRWGLPLIFVGPPGTGKTQRVEATATRYGLHPEVIIGSIREPTDVGGLARLEDDRFRLVPAAWAMSLGEKKHGVVVLDELNTNVPAMQAAMLRLATDGAVGEYMLPPTVRILAMMNRVEESAGGWDLTPPLANRFGHLQWDAPSVNEWSAWLLGGNEDDDKVESAKAIEARVLEAFDAPYAKAKGTVAGFLKAQPGLLHKMPNAGSPEAGRAWPSPRTWEMLVRGLAGAEVHGLSEVDTQEFISGFVGVGAAAEFLQYLTKADLPDPADVLDEKVTFKHDPKRLDRTTAVLNACAATIAPDKAPNRAARADVLWKIIAAVSKDAADVTVQAATVLAKKGFVKSKDAFTALDKLRPILNAAGYMANNS
jgi:MoxR-like ATPase